MHLILIAKAPGEGTSTASIYHHRITQAWRQNGGAAELISLNGPIHPDFTRSLPEGTLIVVDGAALGLIEAIIGPLQAHGAGVLIHHPTPLAPGTSTDLQTEMKSLERRYLPRFRCVVATSALVATRLEQEFGVGAARIRVVNPGIDKQEQRIIRPDLPDGAPCRVLTLGTMSYHKGHDVVLNALATLSDLDWHLTLAGPPRDRAYFSDLKALIQRLDIGDRVDFHGELRDPEMEASWQQAEIFALATRFEGFGATIAEAMARGLPVAITAGGAAADLVTPACGVVAPVDNTAEFAKGLRRLIFSAALRADLGKNAFIRAQGFPDWLTQANCLLAALTR